MANVEIDFAESWCVPGQTRGKCVDFHPTCQWIVIARFDGSIELWDYEHHVLLQTFFHPDPTNARRRGQAAPTRCVAFHPFKNIIAAGNDDYKIELFYYNITPNDLNNNDISNHEPQDKTKKTSTICNKKDSDSKHSDDNNGSDDSNESNENKSNHDNIDYRVTLESQKTIIGHLDYIRTAKFYPQEFVENEDDYKMRLLLSCSDDQTARIWDYHNRKELDILTGHGHYIMCAQWCIIPGKENIDNRIMVLTASLDGCARLFSIKISMIINNNNGIKKQKLKTIKEKTSSYLKTSRRGIHHDYNKILNDNKDDGKKEDDHDDDEHDEEEKIEFKIEHKLLCEYFNAPEVGRRGTNWIDSDWYHAYNYNTIFAVSKKDNTRLDIIRLVACDDGHRVRSIQIIIDENDNILENFEQTINGHSHNVSCAQFYHSRINGKDYCFIFSVSEDRSLRIWRLKNSAPNSTQISISNAQNLPIHVFGSYGALARGWHVCTNKQNNTMAVSHDFGVILHQIKVVPVHVNEHENQNQNQHNMDSGNLTNNDDVWIAPNNPVLSIGKHDENGNINENDDENDVLIDVTSPRRNLRTTNVDTYHEQEESMLRHELISIARDYKRTGALNKLVGSSKHKGCCSQAMGALIDARWRIFDSIFLILWINLFAFISIYCISCDHDDNGYQNGYQVTLGYQMWLIVGTFLYLLIARLITLFIALKRFAIFMIGGIFTHVLVAIFTNLLFDISYWSIAFGFWVFLAFNGIVAAMLRVNRSRFKDHNQSYSQLIEWLQKKTNNCNNIKNDKIIRLIAINLCIDCKDTKLKDCFYGINMDTIDSIVASNEMKIEFCQLIDRFGCNINNDGYASSVNLKRYFINKHLKWDLKINNSCTNCNKTCCYKAWDVIGFYLFFVLISFMAILVCIAAPITLTKDASGQQWRLANDIFLAVFFISLVIYGLLVFVFVKKYWIELEIAPTVKTFDNKVSLSPIHLEYIENCYQNMISYQVKCQILQGYLLGIQDIAYIILNYLPQLGEVKFDVANQLDNDGDHDDDKPVAIVSSGPDQDEISVRRSLLG